MFSNSSFQRLAVCAVSVNLLLLVQIAHSADIAYKIRQGSDASVSFELAFGFVVLDVPLVGWVSDDPEDPTSGALEVGLAFDGRAEWKGLFVETIFHSFNSIALGYTPWSNDKTSVDLLITDGLGRYEPGIGAFQSVENRGSDVVAGIRATHHFDKTLVQLEVSSDVSGKHDGQMVALQLGRFRQVRNWNLHGLIGARYFTDNMLDHYFGISEAESTADIPRYEASGGTLASLEIGATLPLTEKWIFKSTAEGLYLPDSVSDSPLADDRVAVIVSTSVNYVF